MKLLIPGPVNVNEKYLQAMTKPMIGHRSEEFQELHKKITQTLQELFKTKNDVFIITASASGAMESAIRNTVNENVLCLANGDFGRRWSEIAQMNGKNPTLLDFGDATPYNHNKILEELKKRKYDAVTMVINETSTGIENNTHEINKILREYPETLLLTDAVTAAFGTNINTDESDILIFGTQKALALPPGLSIAIINNKAIKRAKDVQNRGYYFDYLAMKKNAEKNFTLTTPAIPLFNALLEKLEDIKKEGLNNHIQKHKNLAKLVREEMTNTGFKLLVDETNASNTLTVIKNTKNITIKEIQENMKREGYELASGYGKLKNETFRIGHMGLDEQTTKDAIKAIQKICEKHGA